VHSVSQNKSKTKIVRVAIYWKIEEKWNRVALWNL